MAMAMSVNDKHVLHALTGRDDPGMVSKMTLVKCLTMIVTERGTLYKELFCENPEHPLFGGLTEEQLAPLRKERMSRRPV